MSGPGTQPDTNGVAIRLGHNGSARFCVCGSRGCSAHNGYPRGSGRLGRMRVRFGRTSWCICVVAVMGLCDRRVGTAWRPTPVIHDGPDCPPTRSAFTLTGPSPVLRCWFDKGTPLIAAKALSWVSPRLTSHSCLVSFDRVSLWTCGSQKGTQHDDPGCVCVLFVCGLAVWM